MRKAIRAAALAILLLMGVAAQGVTFTEQETAACQAQGGNCMAMSPGRFKQALTEAYTAGAKAGAAECVDPRDRT